MAWRTFRLLLHHRDLPLHASVVMAWVQAGKLDFTSLCELPDDFALLAWGQRHLAGFVMLHIRELLHGLVVFLEFGIGAHAELVFDLATVLDHELDRFPLFDGNRCRREAHGVR